MSFREDAEGASRSAGQRYGPQINEGVFEAGDWSQFERQIFQSLIERTRYIFDMQEYQLANRARNASVRKLKIACVSPEFSVGSAGSGAELEIAAFRDGCKLVQASAQHRPQRWYGERLTELRRALDAEPHVVCFSELAYPPPAIEAGRWTIDGIRHQMEQHRMFEEAVRQEQFQRNSEAFLFLGSYHCLLTLYNIGVIYPWGFRREPIDVRLVSERLARGAPERIADLTPVTPPIIYRKRFPARRVEEETRVPAGQEFNIFQTEFGRLSVLICSDVLDVNQFLAVIRRNRVQDRQLHIDFVLVPSFNESPLFPEMCRELSAAAGATVIVANVNHRDADYPDTELYCCGLTLEELRLIRLAGVTEPLVVVHPDDIQHGGGRHSTVIHYELDLPGIDWLRSTYLQQLQRSGPRGSGPPGNISEAPLA